MTALSSPNQMPPATLDKDYDYYGDANANNPDNSGSSSPPPKDGDHPRVKKGLGAMPMQALVDDRNSVTPPYSVSQKAHGMDPPASAEYEQGETVEGDEALLDLEQLEELHHEAERMKALGNKHMAAQEYTRAYNAYSAALQLSPVGPSSHVFLSNRSAALLSLKRYSAAATDARRAIALAPTFGKAHARLGQSLYFLKDYEGAVAAYEDAIHYEPDNPITKTYLEKARTKWQRQKEKAAKNTGRSAGEEVSVLTAESSVQHTVVNSVATDPNASAAVVTTGFRGQSKAMMDAVGRDMTKAGAVATTRRLPPALEGAEEGDPEEDDDFYNNQDDPDFDEALRIQERANRYLANKNYKFAIEEYTAALFLVPDDENLSPELHLGRAHALNGSRRHESAKIDAKLAIRIKPTPEAYSTLAKSLFYMKDYEGAIEAFAECKAFLPEGESLSMFDRAYLQKAEAALQEELEGGKIPSSNSSKSNTPIPKLKPPKFVSREEALNRPANIPAMPKQWPQQSPRDKQVVKFGPEREILFLSEALGIKLNRGPDGIVRVIEVSPEMPGSPIAREGKIVVGDVIREAAGVDIRRPITNIMWGDTVALIKMAPRPIKLVVASELSGSIMTQRMQAAQNALSPTSAAHFFPSNSSTEESVREHMDRLAVKQAVPSISAAEGEEVISDRIQGTEDVVSSVGVDVKEVVNENVVETMNVMNAEMNGENKVMEAEKGLEETGDEASGGTSWNAGKSLLDDEALHQATLLEEKAGRDSEHAEKASQQASDEKSVAAEFVSQPPPISDLPEDEFQMVGGEIMFSRQPNRCYNGWDNLRWMSFSGTRKVRACDPVYRYVEGRKSFLWNKEEYVPRILAVYQVPNLILVLRRAEDFSELRELLEIPSNAAVDDATLKSHLFVESVIDPKTAKLRLSPLTTASSILPDVSKEDVRRRSCFELINPVESVVLSAVRIRKGSERALTSFNDSGAFLETSGVEYAVTKSICSAHQPKFEDETIAPSDLSWKHQVILGTLQSYVVMGNQKYLDIGIQEAMQSKIGRDEQNPKYLNPRLVDAIDESGKTALHYACGSRFASAVKSLVAAGADVNKRIESDDLTPCHICAKNLDFSSLAVILSVNRRPNVVDSYGRSPMQLAITEGRTVGSQRSPEALDKCITILEKYGGEIDATTGFRHPVCFLAGYWLYDELEVVLRHCNYRYPLRQVNVAAEGISIGALYQYPIHSALISLKKLVPDGLERENGTGDLDTRCIETLRVLFACGFEPNERIEAVVGIFPERSELESFVGFAPVQILASCLLEVSNVRDVLGEAVFTASTKVFVNVVKYLVENGGRLSLEKPPMVRTGQGRESTNNSSFDEDASSDNGTGISKLRSELKISSNKELMKLFDQSGVLESSKMWKTMKPAPASSKSIFFTDKHAIENSTAPGGSDDKSCAICWKSFGMLVRKHRCRLSRRFICDECSSQRVVFHGEEHRVSDGQYLLAKDEAARKSNASPKQEEKMAPQPTYAGTAARLERLEAEENAQRDTLFVGIVSSVTNALAGTSDDLSQADTITGLSSQLNQTRVALNERGAKLDTLADKSDKLVSASQDFAAMAKELNRKSNQGFFW
ncbi:ankyrin repeat domain protein [Nitzschia inconspicua]|uniref:Ankyrin repeat domain protein n=1 Tax=Nitzschia inconspicua TaxID=303405 RepID=A0A9K3LK96_9STRA|nr:ankyrin repeat domain protein [Nitzschia inconspicua]